MDADGENAVSVHERDYEGKVEVVSDAATTQLVDKLDGMQDAEGE